MLITLIYVAALINLNHKKLSIIRFFSILEKQNRFSFDFGFWSSIGFRFDYYSIQIDFIRFFRNRIGALIHPIDSMDIQNLTDFLKIFS